MYFTISIFINIQLIFFFSFLASSFQLRTQQVIQLAKKTDITVNNKKIKFYKKNNKRYFYSNKSKVIWIEAINNIVEPV